MEKQLIYNFFSDDELLRISNKIKFAEKTTAGEICVSIKEYKSFFQKRKSLSELAENEFYHVGIDKTRDKTGILIYITLKERQFYILADKGINEKVSPNTWDNIIAEMQKMFVKGSFCKGIIYGVERVGKILNENFPIEPGDTDELPNRIII